MRITKAVIEQRMESVAARYLKVTGKPIDPENGYAQCAEFSPVRTENWLCSPAENAHRLYGEWSSLADLVRG